MTIYLLWFFPSFVFRIAPIVFKYHHNYYVSQFYCYWFTVYFHNKLVFTGPLSRTTTVAISWVRCDYLWHILVWPFFTIEINAVTTSWIWIHNTVERVGSHLSLRWCEAGWFDQLPVSWRSAFFLHGAIFEEASRASAFGGCSVWSFCPDWDLQAALTGDVSWHWHGAQVEVQTLQFHVGMSGFTVTMWV